MSAVIAAPELMEAAATDLATIGSTLNAAHITAAAPTLSVLPAAADEVSTRIAHLFSGYAQDYQKLAGDAAAFHEQFVHNLTSSAAAYASAEDISAALLQGLRTTGRSFFNTVEELEFNAMAPLVIATILIVAVVLSPVLGPLSIFGGLIVGGSLFNILGGEVVLTTEVIAKAITGLPAPPGAPVYSFVR